MVAHLTVHDKTAALEAVPMAGRPGPQRGSRQATGTYDVPPDPPHRRAAHTQRAGAKTCGALQQHATKDGVDGTAGNPLRVRGRPAIVERESSHARVAQLDRASVYGTEG